MTPGFISYCLNDDGVPSLWNGTIGGIYDQLVEDGAGGRMFTEGDIPNRAAFIAMAKRADTHFVAVCDRDALPPDGSDINIPIVAVFWLNRIEHRRACCHFSVYKAFRSHSIEIGKAGLAYSFRLTDAAGKPALDLLWGVCAASNKAAVAYAQHCGGSFGCVVPKYLWNDAQQISEDAVFIHYARG